MLLQGLLVKILMTSERNQRGVVIDKKSRLVNLVINAVGVLNVS